jgi:Leucine-rich repeat (LRR) protein
MSNDALLNLWKKDLRCVPDWVWERTTLETLILADKGLKEVSEKLGELTHLRTLDLGHNQLVSLPESLGELTELSDFLYLHDNPLIDSQASKVALSKHQREFNFCFSRINLQFVQPD